MLPGEFYSDKFLMFHISHKFAGIRIFNKEIFPDFIYRGLIGDMKNMEDHQLISFDTPDLYYQEAGLEFNQLFMGVFGVGAYYRMGDRKSTRLNSSHVAISYAVFCLKKKRKIYKS